MGLTTWVRTALDTNFFNVIGKLSFCTYLMHYMTIIWELYGRDYDYYYTASDTIVFFFSQFASSVALGYLLAVLVEIPFSKMEKNLLTSLHGKFIQKKVVVK